MQAESIIDDLILFRHVKSSRNMLFHCYESRVVRGLLQTKRSSVWSQSFRKNSPVYRYDPVAVDVLDRSTCELELDTFTYSWKQSFN